VRDNSTELHELRELLPSQTHSTAPQKQQQTATETKYQRTRREKLERLLEEDEMKFSHSLQFNSVPDWSSHYIAYSNLKKL
jgi:cysteine synthase